MKKVLFIATYGDFLATFELSNIMLLQEMGYEVHCASNFSAEGYNRKVNKLDDIGVIRHNIEFVRSPLKIENIAIFKELVNLIGREKFEIIDCHNAVIGVLGRLAAKKCNINKVIYTPHSFFFYKGAPLKNNIIYKNVETFLARFTDVLVGINMEDYEAAKKMSVRGKALYVPGVGIDVNAIRSLPTNRVRYCNEFNIPENAVIFVSVGELIPRKNHISALKAFADANINNSYYIICGFGQLDQELKSQAMELGIADRVIFAGFRLDAKEIMKASDVFIFPSFQEGLSVALMEAMACNLPCIASNIRGNVDLIDVEKGGLLFNPNDVETLVRHIKYISEKVDLRKQYGRYNGNKADTYDLKNVQEIMRKEYSVLLSN